jgi:hypothetical protein
MTETNYKAFNEIRKQVGDIHKLLFADLSDKPAEDLKERFKAEILLGFKKSRK